MRRGSSSRTAEAARAGRAGSACWGSPRLLRCASVTWLSCTAGWAGQPRRGRLRSATTARTRRGAEPSIRTVPESLGGRRPDQTAPATALQGDTSTDQQHDHDAPHRGGQQYPAAGSSRQQQGRQREPGDCRCKQEPVATSRDFLEARIVQRSEMVTPGSQHEERGQQRYHPTRCVVVWLHARRTAASAFSGQQHRLSSGAVPNSRPRPGWSDRAAADPGCWDRNRTL